MVPNAYRAGCADPVLAPGTLSKVNAGRLATAYGKCKRLQADTANWAQCYLADVGNKPLPAICVKFPEYAKRMGKRR